MKPPDVDPDLVGRPGTGQARSRPKADPGCQRAHVADIARARPRASTPTPNRGCAERGAVRRLTRAASAPMSPTLPGPAPGPVPRPQIGGVGRGASDGGA